MTTPSLLPHSLIRYLPVIVGLLSVLLTCLPLFHSGFFRPHDFTHAARIAEMNRSLRAGEFPVRWSENFGFGYGMPLFSFYAPLPYYIAQIPYVITANAITAIKFLYALNAVLAFSGMYLLSKRFWKQLGAASPELIAILSATLFTFATYRALDLYVRGALGEATAMVLLPFALYGVLRLNDSIKSGIAWVSISLAAILLSHNLSGMLSVPLILIFAAATLPQIRNNLALWWAVALGGLLSAFYTLPAFFEKSYTRVEQTITTGYFDYHNHFVALRQFISGTWGYGGSVPGLNDGISFAIGIVPLILFGFALLSIFITTVQARKIQRATVAVASLCLFLGISLFMASEKSVWIWDHIQTLKYLQFPWRFLSFSHVFVALIAGMSIQIVHKRARAIVLLGCVGALIFMQQKFFAPEMYIRDTNEFYSTDASFIQSTMSKTLNDYMPPEIVDDQFPVVAAEPLTPKSPVQMNAVHRTPTHITVQVNCISSCLFDVNVFRFPGWTAFVDGKRSDLHAKQAFPIYSLSVSSGEHTISVQLENTPLRSAANSISLVAAAGIGITYGYSRFKRPIIRSKHRG